MKNFGRFLLSFLFGLLGFFLADKLAASFPLPFLTGLLFASLGFFLFPLLRKLTGAGMRNFAQNIASEVVKQWHPHFTFKKSERRKEQSFPFNPLVMDTSALIDGRIAGVAETGFLSGTIILPQFILAELRQVADNVDELKRNRGKRGLAILESLKKNKQLKFQIIDDDFPQVKEVDEKLIKIAKKYKGKIITCDFNLNKVASLSGIKVLNINELANTLKTIVLPQEEIILKIIQEGKEKNQGVGYLSDGTMIVVENGEKYLGQEVKVIVSRVFQTAAGRMIFAKVEE